MQLPRGFAIGLAYLSAYVGLDWLSFVYEFSIVGITPWNPPPGALDARELIVQIRLQLNQDGSVSTEPQVLNRGNHPQFQVAAESAKRAIRRCAPYKMPIAKYEVWRDVEVNFDPRDMYRG